MKKLFTLILILISTNIFAQGNYTLEWESPMGERCSTAFVVHCEKNNTVPDIYTRTGFYPNEITKVYDGETHVLKNTLTPNLSDTSYLNIGEEVDRFNTLDANNDGVYELVIEKRCNFSSQTDSKIRILNGTNAQVMHELSINACLRDYFFVDIDNDGYIELCVFYTPNGESTERLFVYSTPAQSVGVNENNNEIAKDYELKQNYPNPFNPNTAIEYTLNKNSDVKIIIYDILGKEVNTLVDQKQVPGSYKLNLNGKDLSSGTYFYSLIVDGAAESKKMILIK